MKTVLIVFLIVVVAIVVLYFLLMMPRMTRKPDKQPFLGVLYAHRGLHDNKTEAPENSMAAFRKAVEAGYGIELDIQLSKDKEVVVFHDFTLKRICGAAGKVSDYTYEELQQFHLCDSQEKIPRFEDFLQMVDGRVPLIVELKIEGKDTSLCPLADGLLRKYQGVYCIESFNPLGLFWYHRNHNEIFRGQLSESFMKEGPLRGPLYFVLDHLLFNFLTKPDFIAYNYKHYKSFSRRICRTLYHNVAAAWTIKTQKDLDAMKEQFDIFIFDSFIPKES